MTTTEPIAPLETEPLSWTEICTRYPDQFVCVVDMERPLRGSPEISSARVVGHGATYEAAFEPIRELGERYPGFAVRYTGVCTEPLIRPWVVLTDEDREIAARPLVCWPRVYR